MKTISTLLLAVLASCATVGAKLEAFKDGAVTCLKNDEPAVKALGLTLVTVAAADLFAGKSPDETFSDVESRASEGALAQGIPVAACALDDTVNDLVALLHPKAPAGTAVSALVTFQPDPMDSGRRALADFNAVHGVTSLSRQ